MRNANLTLLLIPLVSFGLWGCGAVEGDDFEAGNRLTVTAITGENGESTLVSAALKKTDDSGSDGDSATIDADGTQNNGWPDPNEPTESGGELTPDSGVISLRNAARLGVEEGVSLNVYRVDITYVDAAGNSHSYAPTKSYDVTLDVPTDSEADLTGVILVPLEMKNAIGNLMLNAHSTSVVPQPWRAVVDVYARDELNDDDVHAQGQFSIQFVNPML